MLNTIKKNRFLKLITVCTGLFLPSSVFAQGVADHVISLDTGLWQHQQQTTINGVVMPILGLTRTYCLTESKSNLKVKDYTNKMMNSEGQNCELSELAGGSGSVTFNLICTSPDTPIITKMKMTYDYESQSVRVNGVGTMEGGGIVSPVEINALTQRKGACTDAQLEEAKSAEHQPEIVTKPIAETGKAEAENKKTKSSSPLINRLKASELRDYLKNYKGDKPVVVHYSSNDRKCLHCINDNISMKIAAEQLQDQFEFVQITFDPWTSFTKKYRSLGGLPTTQIYDGIVPISKVRGFQTEKAEALTNAHNKTRKVLDDDYSDVDVAVITSKELKLLVERERGSKGLLVHLTSNNEKACPFCTKNNSFYRAASREFPDYYEFAEVQYEQLNDLKSDKTLINYLKSQKINVSSGLPVTLFFGKKGQVNQRKGIWINMVDDIKASIDKAAK